jgi:hypothetical protein
VPSRLTLLRILSRFLRLRRLHREDDEVVSRLPRTARRRFTFIHGRFWSERAPACGHQLLSIAALVAGLLAICRGHTDWSGRMTDWQTLRTGSSVPPTRICISVTVRFASYMLFFSMLSTSTVHSIGVEVFALA